MRCFRCYCSQLPEDAKELEDVFDLRNGFVVNFFLQVVRVAGWMECLRA